LPVTHRSLWLLACEGIKAHATDGSLRFMGNRFWSDFMVAQAGKQMTIRFDPDAIQAGLHVYDAESRFLGIADCVEKVGYNDKEGAKKHHKAKSAFKRAGRALAEAELSLSIPDLIALRAAVEEPEPPIDTKVVRFMARGNAALKPILQEEDDPQEEQMHQAMRQMNQALRGRGHLRAVTEDE
jgi:hypothetical protein